MLMMGEVSKAIVQYNVMRVAQVRLFILIFMVAVMGVIDGVVEKKQSDESVTSV
jgi:hypothetical protein